MPGKLRRHTYDLVEETYDSKVPVHNETAFEHGIRFKVKYIGTREISKPNSRAEIVASMRRIRHDNKLQGVKKQVAIIVIGMEGLKVLRQKPKGNIFQKRKMREFVEVELSSHPIHKIFYVSHDSQDLQIFSYIAKDDDHFKCSVFKAETKAEAVHVVRTVGQAFEVCHKRASQLSDASPKSPNENKENQEDHEEECSTPEEKEETPTSVKSTENSVDQQTTTTESDSSASWLTPDNKPPVLHEDSLNDSIGLSLEKLRQVYHLKVTHYRQEAEAAKTNAQLIADKLTLETTARTETQKQLEAVLKQNKELISTVQQMVAQIHALHTQRYNMSTSHGMRLSSYSTSSSLTSTPTLTPKTTGSLRKNLGEPTLPFIPPPPISPAHSRQSSNDSWSSLGAKLGTNHDKNDVFPEISNAASSSDLELAESKRNPPPQEFLRFVFDNSNSSDYLMTSEASSSASTLVTDDRGQSVTKATPNGVQKIDDKPKISNTIST